MTQRLVFSGCLTRSRPNASPDFLCGSRCNVALYPPGEQCDAFGGCPVFPRVWVAVYWYPGRTETITTHTSEASARRHIEATGLREYA